MAVGYHRLNTSTARSKRLPRNEIPRDKITVVRAGASVLDATYGVGKTMECFVSDCDKVRVEFESGYTVTMRGGAVRRGIADREKTNQK